ncbi:TlpA family protein disulfide reductase [Aeromicrobium sp.]|uniref:TlpA family protein disulfide reductase n=1 Tax=Aeromicrobium sp. TaxID=1871063 RepID=UPI003D6C3733
MTVRAVIAAVLVAVLAAGCGSEGKEKPTFGGGSEPAGASTAELVELKAAAKIEDCPTSAKMASGKDALPDLELDCLGGGRPVNLAGLTGKPVVINLWASWCKECRDELPLLARAHREYGDRVQFIGIDVVDAAPEAALRLAGQSGITYPQLVDRPGRTRAPLHYAGLPQTVFVDAQGRMVFTERTPFRSYADVTAAISRHLGVTS